MWASAKSVKWTGWPNSSTSSSSVCEDSSRERASGTATGSLCMALSAALERALARQAARRCGPTSAATDLLIMQTCRLDGVRQLRRGMAQHKAARTNQVRAMPHLMRGLSLSPSAAHARTLCCCHMGRKRLKRGCQIMHAHCAARLKGRELDRHCRQKGKGHIS